jgi:hypothetical protein
VSQFLNGPPSVADRLVFGMPVADEAAVVKARKAAAKDMLDTWQRSWDKASRQGGGGQYASPSKICDV